MRLSLKEKLGFGIGDLACNLVFNTITFYLMFFYTDVYGISAAAAATLLLLARLMDGVWDVGVGLWVDRTQSRWGRCRPFLLFAAPLLALMAVACFYVPETNQVNKLIFAYVSYIGLMMVYSLVTIPYAAMPTLITADPDQRTRLQSVRMFCGVAGSLIVSSVTLPLVGWFGKGQAAHGYFLTMSLYGVVALALLWICFARTKERVSSAAEAPEIGPDLRATLGSRPWWLLALAMLCVFTAFLLPASVTMYYFTYVVGDISRVGSFFVVGNLGSFVGILISDQLAQRFCKRDVTRCLAVCTSGIFLMYLVVDPASTWQLLTLSGLASASLFGIAPLVMSMMADTADSIELKTGRRVVGLSSSAISLAAKVGMGLGSAIAGILLTAFGYQAGAIQSLSALQGIRLSMSVAPAVTMLLFAGLMSLYPLNRSALSRIQRELALQRNSRAATIKSSVPLNT